MSSFPKSCARPIVISGGTARGGISQLSKHHRKGDHRSIDSSRFGQVHQGAILGHDQGHHPLGLSSSETRHQIEQATFGAAGLSARTEEKNFHLAGKGQKKGREAADWIVD